MTMPNAARLILALTATPFLWGAVRADDDTPDSGHAAADAAAVHSADAPIRRIEPAPGEPAPTVKFSTDAKWQVAGYNDDEIVFTIFLKNEDTRIIRCDTRMSGSYYENGRKVSIADRQTTTVLPDQSAQVGNWMGMDEKSGATYSVTCRPV